MRNAGYCSECNGYVWLDQRGDCMYGHPRHYLRDVHQAEVLPNPAGSPPDTSVAAPPAGTDGQEGQVVTPPPPSPPTPHPDQPYPPYGYGQQYPGQYAGQYPGQEPLPGQPYPPYPSQQTQVGPDGLPWGVPKFNWGAFLLPVIWPLIYGVPMYAGIALLANLIANAANTFAPVIALPLSLAALGVDVWVGFAAHKAFWRRYPNKMSVDEYRAKQVKWVVVGVVLLLILFGLGVLSGIMMIANENPASLGL